MGPTKEDFEAYVVGTAILKDGVVDPGSREICAGHPAIVKPHPGEGAMGEGGDAEVAPLEYHVDEPGVFEVRPGQVGFREPGAEQFGVSGIDLREVAADLGRLDMSLVCQQIPFKLMKIRGHPWRRRHGNVWAEASQKGTRRS